LITRLRLGEDEKTGRKKAQETQNGLNSLSSFCVFCAFLRQTVSWP
jgi:hypothetical protein